MALGKFYNKNALAASHVLRGFDHQSFSETLSSNKIAVYFDEAAEQTREGRWTLELAVNLIARLYPRVSIVSRKESSMTARLAEIATAINPLIEIDRSLEPSSLCLVVGRSLPPGGRLSIYVGSEGWVTKISTQGPVGSTDSAIPFGADASACIGVANLFRMIFQSQLEDGRCDEMWKMSLLDFDPGNPAPPNPQTMDVDFSETHLVGLGAIGNGCVWTLSRMQGMRGTLHLVDPQDVELSNLQRYVLTTDSSEGKVKVELSKEHLANTGLNVIEHCKRWGNYAAERNNWKLPRVAVAVDSETDRYAVQAALPEWLVNAWTQTGDLGLSRHTFVGEQACLACLYIGNGSKKNEDELVAESIGLPAEARTMRALLMTGAPLDRAFLQKVAEATKIDVEQLLQFEGQPLRNFYSKAVCGGILLRLGAVPSTQKSVEVPMAFQSALAGIFLAAELVAKAAGLRDNPLQATTKVDLLRPIGKHLSLNAKKHPSGNCICQDPDYIQVYKLKYGSP